MFKEPVREQCIVNKEKFKTWEAYKLTNEGVSRWNEIEQYFNDKQVSKSQVLNDLTSSFDFDFQSNKNIINKIKDTFIKREEIKKG